MPKTILVFTGGGIAAALNATLYGVITEAQKKGYKILGGIEGWQSLLKGGKTTDFSDVDVSILQTHGGTILRSSRVNPLKVEKGMEQLKERIKELSLDGIIAIGGDDTLGAALEVSKTVELSVVGIPKTVDNDLTGTYWCPGFPTAASKIVSITKQTKEDTAYGLKRIFLIETIGMKAGWIPAASCLANPDLIVVPEREVPLDLLLELIEQRYKNNGEYATVVIAEEVRFKGGLKGMADNQPDNFRNESRQNFISIGLREEIKNHLGIYAQCIIPRNYLQSGQPIEIDREFAVKLGQHAVGSISRNETGTMSCIVKKDKSRNEFTVSSVPLTEVAGKENHRVLDETLFDFDNFVVTEKMRDYISSIIGESSSDSAYSGLEKKIIRL
ncbi:MAG: hypothetical protein COY66_02310 [Candidatus Kerfeldbacteria bacterium CG_4_10_14_0_8_um_filter_42_10]|uniref:Phosphofructokinase domain-containing protein n=1 Tax=Candidatus Kerfeldbacteria bacterium CG_4_10_14_0_8_um_filter_42_10 TaxID=2014248 RepID=A0A2M7RJD1_9BACT|nr:MAG: hypothetical protein COY66_02310 [Candidatus Kerfeldbacteria bacterium CG_4_10_14_0_8_um_filter_42_10]